MLRLHLTSIKDFKDVNYWDFLLKLSEKESLRNLLFSIKTELFCCFLKCISFLKLLISVWKMKGHLNNVCIFWKNLLEFSRLYSQINLAIHLRQLTSWNSLIERNHLDQKIFRFVIFNSRFSEQFFVLLFYDNQLIVALVLCRRLKIEFSPF